MEPSLKKRKQELRTSIIAMAVLALVVAVFFAFHSRTSTNSLENIEKEQARFAEVLRQASDEELFIVLKYAIAHHYVPTRDIDPYSNVFAGVWSWHRTKMVYDKLTRRPDLLRKIYPDLVVLRDYVNRNEYVRPFTDTVAAQTILHNAQKDGKYDVDLLMGVRSDKASLAYKYFGTPLLHD